MTTTVNEHHGHGRYRHEALFYNDEDEFMLGVLGFNNGVRYLGALNTMLMLNLIPIIVFAIEAWLGRSFAGVEIGGAAIVIGALAANNLYLRRMAPPA